MATINMNDLKLSMGIDPNASETSPMTSVAKKSEKGSMTVGRLQGRTIDESKALIKKVLAGATEPMTRSEIFKAMDRKNTPHLRNILTQLVDAGEVMEEVELAPNRLLTCYWYWLP